MKSSFKYLVAIGFMWNSIAAHAIVRPGWERPIMRADLVEFDGTGHELTQGLEKTLTMNKRDGQRKPTSFTFVEEQRIFCVTAPCPQPKLISQFRVLSAKKDSCGSIHYKAVESGFQFMHELVKSPKHLEVVDHSTRLCEDYRPYGWDVEMVIPGEHGREIAQIRTFGGNPEAVYTIQ